MGTRQTSLPFDRKSLALRRLWPQWQELTAGAPPFLTPEFFALNRRLTDEGEALLVAAFNAERLTGVLPLLLERRKLFAFRSEHTPRFDYFGEPKALEGIWAELMRDFRWDVMVLRNLPVGSPLLTGMAALCERHHCLFALQPGNRCPYFALPGFEERMNGKFRTNVKRCARKLGDLRYQRISRFSRRDLEEGFAIEAMAWKGEAGTSISSDERLHRFYLSLARVFGPRGQMSLHFVSTGPKRVAFLFSLEDQGSLYAIKTGYDPAYSSVSPGHLVIHEAARDAEQRGLQQFDFMGVEAEWKLKWTDLAREHVHAVVYRPSPLGLAEYLYREVVKPRLSPRWLDLLKRLRA